MSIVAICLGLQAFKPKKGNPRKVEYIEVGQSSKTDCKKMRDQILDRFASRPDFTALDVMQEFKLDSRYAVKHHLNYLYRKGILARNTERVKEGYLLSTYRVINAS